MGYLGRTSWPNGVFATACVQQCTQRVTQELDIKVAKRLIKENTSRGRELNTNKVMRALLQYLNIPLKGVKDSPVKTLVQLSK